MQKRTGAGAGVGAAVAATLIVAGSAALAAAGLTAAGAAAALLMRQAARLGFVWTDGSGLAAMLVFVAVYAVIAIGKLPGFQLDRAGAALLGASLMVGVGALTLDEAYRAVDFDTITLLLGMMIVVANLRLSGFFKLASDAVAARARHPLALLAAVVAVSGVFSAFLVNDAICLVMTPLVLDLARRSGRNPVPYLLATAMASNVGSVATITGNPQNMMIGSFSRIPYGAFASALWPVAAAGLLLTAAFVALAYPKEFFTRAPLPAARVTRGRPHAALMLKAVAVTGAMMAFFFAGQPVAKVAIVGGSILLLTRRVSAGRVDREIDWPLLLMFAGLFITVAGLQKAALTPQLLDAVSRLDLGRPALLAGITALLSNVVSNVPAVLALRPFVDGAGDPQRAWLVVAMASTLAGNFTLLGSVANLIVAQKARAEGVELGFWPYFRIGAPLTIATIAIGVWRLGGY